MSTKTTILFVFKMGKNSCISSKCTIIQPITNPSHLICPQVLLLPVKVSISHLYIINHRPVDSVSFYLTSEAFVSLIYPLHLTPTSLTKCQRPHLSSDAPAFSTEKLSKTLHHLRPIHLPHMITVSFRSC